MKLVKTVKCKLQPTAEQGTALRETMQHFAGACNDILCCSKENRTTNKVKLQHLIYYTLRERYHLPANLVIRAIARVADQLKRPRKPKSFKANSFNLDARTFSFNNRRMTVSISSISGRLKDIKLSIGNYQFSLLQGQHPISAVLFYHQCKKCFYINIVLTREVPTPCKSSGGNSIGVDIGIRNLAATSDGMRFPGKKAMHIRRHYVKLRSALQAKGTKGAKKLLKRLSGKESRTIADINHVISRRIVDSTNPGDELVLENLKHIRERTMVRKKQRYIHESWPFYQLQHFLTYKANERGISVVFIDPHYTSQQCSRCGQIGHRNRDLFRCPCGYRNHADFNASYNLSLRRHGHNDGLPSVSPEVSSILGTSP